MDVAVAEEPLRTIFRAKKTMKVSDRRQLESLHTTLSSPCSFSSPPQPAMVNGKHCEDVSMEVDKEIHGTTHTTTHAPSSLTATSLTTETSEEPTASELLVSSSQNIHSDVKDVQEEGEGDKESTLPSLEVEDKMNGLIKVDKNSKEDVIVSSPVSSEKTEAVRERQVDGMEVDLVPGTTQDTVPILNPAASLLLSSNTAVESVSSPSLSPSYTAESDQEVRPGFLVLSEDDDEEEEEKDEKEEEQRESEGGVEKVEVNMEKPEQFESGAPVDCPSPSSPTPLQIDEEEEEGAALQKKRSLSGDSEDGGQKQGERDLEVAERHHKRPRVDCEELEAHVELKISGSAERQHKLKKLVQQLIEQKLCVLQLTLFDKSLQGLRDRLDKIEKHPSALKSLQAKIGRLSKKVGTANQARENAKNHPEVLLPPTSTSATATTPAGSAVLGLRTMGNNTPDPKRNDQSSQTPTPVRNDQGCQTPTPVRTDQGCQTPTPVPTAPLLPSPSSTASAGSQPTSQTLMLSTCVTPAPGPSAFPLQSFLIQLPGGGTAILTNPTNSQLIPVCALPAMTSSTVTPTTAFLLQRTTPYTPAAPKPPSASALLSHFAATTTTTTTPTDSPAATTSHITTPWATTITTPRATTITTPRATTITTPRATTITTPRATTITTPRATTITTPRATTITTPRATPITTPWATTITTPRATTITTPRATTITTPRATTITTPRATTITTPRATTITTPRATTITTPRATTITTPRATTITTPRATTITTPRATTITTTTPWAIPMATHTTTPTATPITTPITTPRTTPRTITTPTRRATTITTLCATPNVSHSGATGTVSRPSSSVSVSVCESIRLVSVANSTSSLPRFSMPATTGTQPSVRPAAPAQLAAPLPQVPVKTGSESTNPPSDSTQASHHAKSEAFIDLTEEEEEDDDDVLVTGVLKAPMALKASPSPSTAGQRTTATQQTATSTSVGTQAVRSSLGQTGSPRAVYHRPLQGSPSESVASATTTSSSSTPCPQPSPLPPLPVPPQTISLPLEAASTSPPQQPLLKITRVLSQNDGIVLSWSVTEVDGSCAAVDSYHLYAYHQDHSGPSTPPLLWKKIGEVKALALPMACTLTQFVSGSKYYFAVRARDVFGRFGPFCAPQCTDVLTSPSPKAPI
ncbi:activating transcription factor 7-interacting protein 1-like [Salvelinus namaycush]|uniref:Activating transcription factor 7-interacting protein 1-like n=1 Tax=Salvelinus namaycush TaxID=8040 RepID=A0A8U0UD62_SALNM|nr:activating transcription factor 7-interacting protein 1-like [Salvelinus namaycush]